MTENSTNALDQKSVNSPTANAFVAKPASDLSEGNAVNLALRGITNREISSVETSIDENRANELRLNSFKRKFTESLRNSLLDQPVETGEYHPGERIIREAVSENRMAAVVWIQSFFNECYRKNDIECIYSLLLLCSRMPSSALDPANNTMGVMAIAHNDDSIKEAGIRVFERKISSDSLEYLKATDCASRRLSRYKISVIREMERALGYAATS